MGATRLTESLLLAEIYTPMFSPLAAAASGKSVSVTQVRRRLPNAMSRLLECGPLSRRVIAECHDCDAATKVVWSCSVCWRPGIRFDWISLPTVLLASTQYSAAFGAFFLDCLYAGIVALAFALFELLGIRRGRRCRFRVNFSVAAQ